MLAELKFELEVLVPNCFTLTLFEKNVIEVSWDKNLKMVEKKHIELLKEKIKELGKGNKMLLYISTIDLLNISHEAREYSASDENQEYTLANAVLIDNLAKKLIFNLFLGLTKPKTPTKAFTSRESAIAWLLEIRNK